MVTSIIVEAGPLEVFVYNSALGYSLKRYSTCPRHQAFGQTSHALTARGLATAITIMWSWQSRAFAIERKSKLSIQEGLRAVKVAIPGAVLEYMSPSAV